MTPSVPDTSCARRESIDRHFAGAISPAAEHALREHLGTCEDCRAYYQRHLLLARLDPAALGARERLSRGLGLRPRARPLWAGGALALAAAAAAAALVVALAPGLRARSDEGFAARGGPAAPAAVGLSVFEVVGGRAALVGDRIADGGELAFSYQNRAGKKRLLVFAVDEQQKVYWFFPAWLDASADPEAIAIERTEAPRELTEAVVHRFAGEKVTLHAVFTDEPVTVREVERRLKAGQPASPGAENLARPLTVVRGEGR